MMSIVYPTCLRLAAALVMLSAGCRAADRGPAEQSERVSESRRLMGVPWTITVHARTAADGRAALAAAFAEVARLERILSDYDAGSELSRLSASAPTTRPVPVSDDLWLVLAESVAWRDRSGGAFDPSVGPVTTLWRQSRRSGVLPRPDKLAAARRTVGREHLTLDPENKAVTLGRPGMRLDLGGIGIGYAVDRALDVLAARGIASAMVDASGDIAVTAPPPGRTAWTIDVAPFGTDGRRGEAAAMIALVDAAVTTSGDAFQAVEIDGVRYSHVVDPRTGIGVPGPAAVTVIAADCTTADAAATAANVLGPEAGLEFVESIPGAAARFVAAVDGHVVEVRSSRWPAHSPQTSE